MSSMTKAPARPVSTIRNASAWSLAARMLRLSPFCAPISVICLILVVPEVDTTVLPLRSSTVLRFADFFDTKRFAVTKCVMVNETCFWRSRLLVVEPHSRSTVPLAINGMRVAEVTGLSLVSRFASLRSFFTPSTIRAEIHGVAHDLLLVVVVGERHRGLAVAERDRAGLLDLLERAGEVLRERWASGEGRRRDHRKQHFEMHWSSPL